MSSRAYRPPPGRDETARPAAHGTAAHGSPSHAPAALPAPKPMGIAPSTSSAPPSRPAAPPAFSDAEEGTGLVDLRKLAMRTGSSLQVKAFDPAAMAPPPLAPQPVDPWSAHATAAVLSQQQQPPKPDRSVLYALIGAAVLVLGIGGGATAWLLHQRKLTAMPNAELAAPVAEPPVPHEVVQRSKTAPDPALSDDAALADASPAPAPRKATSRPRGSGQKSAGTSKSNASKPSKAKDPCGCKGVLACVMRCEAGR